MNYPEFETSFETRFQTHKKACPGGGLHSRSDSIRLGNGFPTGVGKSISPEQKHRQKGEKPI